MKGLACMVLGAWSLLGGLDAAGQAAPHRSETHQLYIPPAAFYVPDFPTLRYALPAFMERYPVPSAPIPSTDDPWLGRDKMQHLAFSFLLTLGSQYVLVNKGGYAEARALPLSALGTAAVGVTKELYDRQKPKGFFSTRDLVADGLGIALAVGLIAW